MGASAILKSVDFRAFAVNVKTIARGRYLYQSGHAIWCERSEISQLEKFPPTRSFLEYRFGMMEIGRICGKVGKNLVRELVKSFTNFYGAKFTGFL